MLIQRPTVAFAGIAYKPVSKSAPALAKQTADDALDANTAVEIANIFQAVEATDALIKSHEQTLAQARAAASILIDGELPEGASGDLVACAKRIHDLSEALDRPRDIDRERAEDLVAGLEHDLERAKTAQDRATKRAQYAFAKALVAGCDPSLMSKASRYAHPPVTFSKYDLDYAYHPGTRVLKGTDREWPDEAADPDDMRATMVAVICEDVLAAHTKQAERKASHEKLTASQRERAETQQAADDLAAQIKGSL